jgi:hypothetical protein
VLGDHQWLRVAPVLASNGEPPAGDALDALLDAALLDAMARQDEASRKGTGIELFQSISACRLIFTRLSPAIDARQSDLGHRRRQT